MSVEGVLLTIFERSGVSEETAREITQAMTVCVEARNRAYETRIEQIERLVYVPGMWRCPKCKFNLNRVEIHAESGRMRAATESEPCPNCRTELQRVTEREASNEVCDRLDKLHAKMTEVTKDRDQLKMIWEAASDYMMGHANEGFANENGGLAILRAHLQVLIDAYESGVEIEVHPPTAVFELESEMEEAPRITADFLNELIAVEYYFTANTAVPNKVISYVDMDWDGPHPSLALHTFCVLVMKSGATITGESCCASPENFDEEKGRQAARSRAMTKAFELEGYKLAAERKATGQ